MAVLDALRGCVGPEPSRTRHQFGQTLTWREEQMIRIGIQQGMTKPEIAEAVGCHLATVYVWLNREPRPLLQADRSLKRAS